MFHVIDKNGITVSVVDVSSIDGVEIQVPDGGALVEGPGVLLGKGNTPRPACPGDDYVFDEETFAWVIPRENVAGHQRGVLLKRQMLLFGSDWTQLPDVPLATKEAWATYRQALRDITKQPGFPLDVTWPVAPG